MSDDDDLSNEMRSAMLDFIARLSLMSELSADCRGDWPLELTPSQKSHDYNAMAMGVMISVPE